MCIQVYLYLYLCNFGPERVYWMYFPSGQYCIRLPSPLVMTCSILIRDSLRFFKYSFFSNLVQNVILEKSLQNTYFQALHFYIFLPSLIKMTFVVQEIKHFQHFFTPKIVKCQFFSFFKKPCQIKHFNLITMKICQQHPKGRPHTQ